MGRMEAHAPPGLWLTSLGSVAPAADSILRALATEQPGGALLAWSDVAAGAWRRPDSGPARRLMAQAGWNAERTIEALAASVVRSAATDLLPLHERTNGRQGLAAVLLPPMHDSQALLEGADRLARLVNRPNLLAGLPATPAGLAAAESSIVIGQATLIGVTASLEGLTQALEACGRGLRARATRGLPPVGCLVAFDPNPVLALVEGRLAAHTGRRAERAASLAGKTLTAILQLAVAQQAAARADLPDPDALGLLILTPLHQVAPRTADQDQTIEWIVGLLSGEPLPQAASAPLGDGLRGDWAMLSSARAHLDALAALDVSIDELGLEAEDAGRSAEAERLARLLREAESEAVTMKAFLGDLGREFQSVLATMETQRVSARLWQGDTSLWTQDAAEANEAASRLGWLLLPEKMETWLGEFEAFRAQLAAEGYRHAVVLGMGGSSLAPDVFRRMLAAGGGLELHVLDSTDPDMVTALAGTIPVESTLFLVSSKSGTTTEPLALLEYFWAVAQPLLGARTGQHFAAITDPGTPLEKLAKERSFRQVFAGPPDVGGRYSALSAFGLLPAALMGADIRAMLAGGGSMGRQCGPTVEAGLHPGLQLGAFLGLAAQQGRDKLTLVSDGGCDPLEDWIEQLVAESSGKKGRGLLPITHEALGPSREYGRDRAFVYLRRAGEFDAAISALSAAGHPVAILDVGPGEAGLGAEFFRWEFAVAVACSHLGISAFDQPDVQRAKDRAAELLKCYRKQGALPTPEALWHAQGMVLEGRPGSIPVAEDADLQAVQGAMVHEAGQGDALCLLAYLPTEPDVERGFQELRSVLRRGRCLPTSLGFGPRYLHSTGQVHKGGPDRALFILITADRLAGVAVPGMGVTFNVLQRAQAIGDLQALLALGRRAWCFHFDSPERLTAWFASFQAVAEPRTGG